MLEHQHLPLLDLSNFYETQSGQNISIDATPSYGYPANYTFQWIHNGYSIPPLFGGNQSSYQIEGNGLYNGNWSVLVSNDTILNN